MLGILDSGKQSGDITGEWRLCKEKQDERKRKHFGLKGTKVAESWERGVGIESQGRLLTCSYLVESPCVKGASAECQQEAPSRESSGRGSLLAEVPNHKEEAAFQA